MIYIKGKPVSLIVSGRNIVNLSTPKLVSLVIRKSRIVWQNIRSCFGKGHWIDDKPWIDDDTWKD